MTDPHPSSKREYVLEIIIIILLILLAGVSAFSQNVGINTTGAAPNGSALLDVSSTAKGMLIPRMTTAQKNAIASPAEGLTVYQTDSIAGFYCYDNTDWYRLTDSRRGWQMTDHGGWTDTIYYPNAFNGGPTIALGELSYPQICLSTRNSYPEIRLHNSNFGAQRSVLVFTEDTAASTGPPATHFMLGRDPLASGFTNYFGLINPTTGWIISARSDGLVGIGGTSNGEKLEVAGAIRVGAAASINTGTIQWDGTDFLGRTGTGWQSLTGGGDTDWTEGGGTVYNQTANVMIGSTTNPNNSRLYMTGTNTRLLEVTTTATGSTPASLSINNASNSADVLTATTNGTGSVGQLSNTNATNAATALTVATNGTGSIASLSGTNTSSSAIGLSVSAAGTGSAVSVTQSLAANTVDAVVATNASTSGRAFRFAGDGRVSPVGALSSLDFDALLAEPLFIPSLNNYGYVGTASQTFYQGHFGTLYYYSGLINASDRRVKENVVPLAGTLDKIVQLNPVTYDYKSEFFSNGVSDAEKLEQLDVQRKDQTGLIAQEVQSLFPSVVEEIDGTEYIGVNYVELVPILIKGMQEQQAQIQALQSEIKKLKTE